MKKVQKTIYNSTFSPFFESSKMVEFVENIVFPSVRIQMGMCLSINFNQEGDFSVMQLQQITDERSANQALKEAVVGKRVRITFKADVGEKFQQKTFLNLRHKLEFDTMWLAVAHNTLAIYGEWRNIPRVQDFTITRMSGADREVFAHILAEITESIEIL